MTFQRYSIKRSGNIIQLKMVRKKLPTPGLLILMETEKLYRFMYKTAGRNFMKIHRAEAESLKADGDKAKRRFVHLSVPNRHFSHRQTLLVVFLENVPL